jgi:uncharacterized protein
VRAAALDDAGGFLAEAEALLLADEARHNLILGIAGTIRSYPDRYPERQFWVVRDGGRCVAAGLRTPPYNLALAQPAAADALDVLVAALANVDLPGVTGGRPEADSFAAAWCALRGVSSRTTMAQGIHALERVTPPPRAAGTARDATAAERSLLLRWLLAFADEAGREGGPGADQAERIVDHRLAAPRSGFLLWEDAGDVVSLAGWGGESPNGIRVGPVYTPPERRGRGYATALTAELSQRLLAAGSRFCFLYTDLANPAANAIYARIGYRRVCESAEIAFDA